MKYGEVISGSVRRGYIKCTKIENGSWYLQIINCAPIELTLADLKLGYSQTITELNAYTVNKPTTHPTHVDRNQRGKSDVIIVTT